MALYLVERDLTDVPPDRLRLEQRDVASACVQLKALGKRIRYISSAVVPADGHCLDLFGAENPEVIEEAHGAAGVQYSRIVAVLDFTPDFIGRKTSSSRRSSRRTVSSTRTSHPKGSTPTMASNSQELAHWLAEGQRFFTLCVETLGNAEALTARSQALESENAMLREEVARLRQRADMLRTERSEMVAAFNDLAGHVTQVVDHILQKSEDGENSTQL